VSTLFFGLAGAAGAAAAWLCFACCSEALKSQQRKKALCCMCRQRAQAIEWKSAYFSQRCKINRIPGAHTLPERGLSLNGVSIKKNEHRHAHEHKTNWPYVALSVASCSVCGCVVSCGFSSGASIPGNNGVSVPKFVDIMLLPVDSESKLNRS
jgi:hypothetical protein